MTPSRPFDGQVESPRPLDLHFDDRSVGRWDKNDVGSEDKIRSSLRDVEVGETANFFCVDELIPVVTFG